MFAAAQFLSLGNQNKTLSIWGRNENEGEDEAGVVAAPTPAEGEIVAEPGLQQPHDGEQQQQQAQPDPGAQAVEAEKRATEVESLVSHVGKSAAKKPKLGGKKEETFQVWDKTGSLLSPSYLKGLTSRIVGNSNNFAEHKILEVNLDIMRKQRFQVMRTFDAKLKREQQMMINNKAEWEMRKMQGKKKSAKARLALQKAKEALQEAMSRPVNRAYMHRMTKAPIENIANLAKGRDYMAVNMRRTMHRFKEILSRIGITGEEERNKAEILLLMRDHLEGLSGFSPEFLKRLQASLPPDSPPSAFEILVDQIKVTQREELLLEYQKAGFEYSNAKKPKPKLKVDANSNRNNVNISFNVNTNATDAMKEQLAALKREMVMQQLCIQSQLLQSHPFVMAAYLMGKEIPYGYGGLGNKGEKKGFEVAEIKTKKKQREDSMDMFNMDDDQPGYNSMHDVFDAINMVDVKDIHDRIGAWLDYLEVAKAKQEEEEKIKMEKEQRKKLAALVN